MKAIIIHEINCSILGTKGVNVKISSIVKIVQNAQIYKSLEISANFRTLGNFGTYPLCAQKAKIIDH